MCHEFKAFFAKVDGEAAFALLADVGDARHVNYILCELVL